MAKYCFPPAHPRHKTIVSSINSATENMAQFLDHYLQPIVKNLPAYLKDTELSNIRIQPDDWLVTVDVKSLYTCIPHNEGIQACHEAWLLQEQYDPQHPPAETLRCLLELALKLNTLEFSKKFYLQILGTAMGFRLAPAYANTFMGKLEKNILDTTKYKPKYYRHFIDDILIIFEHSETELDNFMTHINNANKPIKFTRRASPLSHS